MKSNWKYDEFNLQLAISRNRQIHVLRVVYCMLPFVYCLLISCNNGKESGMEHENHYSHQEQKVYTCPMHPQIIRNEPGQCPICGMNLVAKPGQGQNIQDTSLAILLKPTNEYVLSQIKAIRPVEMKLPVEIDASGIIGYDTREMNTVSARISGRIENLYVKFRFQKVVKGQKLFDIYSPELVTEQENLIYLLNNDPKNSVIIKAAEKKLVLLGLTIEQVEEVKRTKKSFYSVTMYSPYSGHLYEPGTDINSGMQDGMNQDVLTQEELSMKEGMYVEKGQLVFNIYNTENVWALLIVYPENQHLLKLNQRAIIYVDKDKLEAKVDFIEPIIQQDKKFITIRCYLKNPGNSFKIGTVLQAKIYGNGIPGLYIPFPSVLSLGQKKVVFVKDGQLFRAKQVTTGMQTADWIGIISGIDSTAIIAANAQLLIDSESFVKMKQQK